MLIKQSLSSAYVVEGAPAAFSSLRVFQNSYGKALISDLREVELRLSDVISTPF